MSESKEIIQKVNELYILTRKKFLIFNYSGYHTIENKEDRRVMLTDVYVARHLQKKETLGVFAGNIFTKFICFDVDIKDAEMAKMVVYKLVKALQDVGIPGECIHISLSGSKGFHVEIFFQEPIKNEAAKRIFEHVISIAETTDKDLIGIGKVEFRPTASQGVKIPMGRHFKTGNTCWYCDYEKGLKPIKSEKYILSIKPMDISVLRNILDEIFDYNYSREEVNDIEHIMDKYKPKENYYENIQSATTIESVEKLIQEGLTTQGTRHNSLLKIAKYYKFYGYEEIAVKEALVDWLKKQDKVYYSTSWNDCIKDIDGIVSWVFSNNVSFVAKQSIIVDDFEMKQILAAKGKNNKLLLFSLLIHKKRYANKNGVFFMSFSTMKELTGLSESTIISIVRRLESDNFIKVYRNPKKKFINGKLHQETNRYEVFINDENENSNHIFELSLSKNNRNKDLFKECVITLFSPKELKQYLSRREYQSLVA